MGHLDDGADAKGIGADLLQVIPWLSVGGGQPSG
jgi:hypothetical protein